MKNKIIIWLKILFASKEMREHMAEIRTREAAEDFCYEQGLLHKGYGEDWSIDESDACHTGFLAGARYGQVKKMIEAGAVLELERKLDNICGEMMGLQHAHGMYVDLCEKLKAEVKTIEKERGEMKREIEYLRAEIQKRQDDKFELEDAAWHKGYNASLKDGRA